MDTIPFQLCGEALWARMERAVEKVNDRLRKVVSILEGSGVPYAVVGGHAVRAWVAQVDEAAVRTTKNVDILVRRDNFQKLSQVLTAAGFYHREVSGVDMFVDSQDGSARDAVHLVFVGQMVRPGDCEANPEIDPRVHASGFTTITLPALVRMKLNSNRDKDRVHLRDMISVGLIDASWLGRFPSPLNDRLTALLSDPNG
jgi:hypothetical protein